MNILVLKVQFHLQTFYFLFEVFNFELLNIDFLHLYFFDKFHEEVFIFFQCCFKFRTLTYIIENNIYLQQKIYYYKEYFGKTVRVFIYKAE